MVYLYQTVEKELLNMAIVGYARVSTMEQNEARQLKTLTELGAEKIFCDKLSGKNTARHELQKMLDYVREGDTVVISEYSRLARSTKDLLDLVDKLQQKGVALKSIKENLDTNTPTGKFMLTVFAGIAELERATILQRQKEGIAIAKQEGKYKGRQPIPFDEQLFLKECKKWVAGKQTATDTMNKCGMKPNRFYRLVKQYGIKKE